MQIRDWTSADRMELRSAEAVDKKTKTVESRSQRRECLNLKYQLDYALGTATIREGAT